MDDDLSNWRKSSFSYSNGNCAEVAAWRESAGPAVVGVRDTKDRGAGPVLVFGAGAWAAFTAGVKGEPVAH